MKNPNLKKIVDKLHNTYDIVFLDNNVLFVREAADHPVMAQIICAPEAPSTVLVSVAVDYNNSPAIAQLIYDLFHILPFSLTDPFYESNYTGQMSYGQTAYENVQLETDVEFLSSTLPHNVKPI